MEMERRRMGLNGGHYDQCLDLGLWCRGQMETNAVLFTWHSWRPLYWTHLYQYPDNEHPIQCSSIVFRCEMWHYFLFTPVINVPNALQSNTLYVLWSSQVGLSNTAFYLKIFNCLFIELIAWIKKEFDFFSVFSSDFGIHQNFLCRSKLIILFEIFVF